MTDELMADYLMVRGCLAYVSGHLLAGAELGGIDKVQCGRLAKLADQMLKDSLPGGVESGPTLGN